MNLILRWIVVAATVFALATVVDGVTVKSFYTALLISLFLGLLNVTLKPILLVLTLPINILTLGLFTFIINAAILLLLTTIIKGFVISSFALAIAVALIISAVNWLTHKLL